MVGNGDMTGPSVPEHSQRAAPMQSPSNGDCRNQIQYQTPMFGGFQAKFAYSAPETEGKTATGATMKPQVWGASAEYKNGPFYLGLGYESTTI